MRGMAVMVLSRYLTVGYWPPQGLMPKGNYEEGIDTAGSCAHAGAREPSRWSRPTGFGMQPQGHCGSRVSSHIWYGVWELVDFRIAF